MRILDYIAKAAGIPVDVLEKILAAGAAAVPDLGPEVAAKIDALNAAATPESIIALSAAILSEGKNAFGGKLDGREHSGDAI